MILKKGYFFDDKRHNIRSTKKWNLVDMSSRSYHNKLETCEMVDQPWIRWSKISMPWSKQLFVVQGADPSGKNALDAQNLENILGLQIIGRSIIFYLLVLPSEGLYVMYELGTLQLPNNLCDLRKLLMDMPLGLLVLDVFHRLCIRSVDPSQPSRHRPTISVSNFDGIFSTSQGHKRFCHLKKYN